MRSRRFADEEKVYPQYEEDDYDEDEDSSKYRPFIHLSIQQSEWLMMIYMTISSMSFARLKALVKWILDDAKLRIEMNVSNQFHLEFISSQVSLTLNV